MKKEIFVTEVGVLLNTNNPEYDCYKITDYYDLSFYDENRCYYVDLTKAINFAIDYVQGGVVNTYAIVHSYGVQNITKEELKTIKSNAIIDALLDNPTKETTILLIYKNDNGEVTTYETNRQ